MNGSGGSDQSTGDLGLRLETASIRRAGDAGIAQPRILAVPASRTRKAHALQVRIGIIARRSLVMAMRTVTERFESKVYKLGINPIVDVPESVSQRFREHARAGRVLVQGTLNGVPIRSTLVPAGGGRHRMYLNAGMRAAAGVDVGDTARLEVRPCAPDEAPVREEVYAELDRIAGARAVFDALPASGRREWLRYIDDAKTATARLMRVRNAAADMLGKRSEKARRSQDRPLWTCPKCGKQYVNRNQFHSCKRRRVEDAFLGKPARIRDLFDRFLELANAGGTVRTVPNGDWLSLMVRVRFASIRPRKKWLDVTLWLPRRCDSARFRQVETIGPGVHVHTVRLVWPEDLDAELAGWVEQACAIGRRGNRS